jgi:hypothetical protein
MSEIPLDFLLTSSTNSLSEYQLRRLNEAANLRSKALDLITQAIDQEVEARVACWLRMHKEALMKAYCSIEVPTEAMLRRWLATHEEELLRMLPSIHPQKSVNPSDGEPRQLAANASAVDRGTGDADHLG